MLDKYKDLKLVNIDAAKVYCCRAVSAETQSVTLDSPAVSVMTDLEKRQAVTISPTQAIDGALAIMNSARVRMLIVVDESEHVYGIIKAADILGGTPTRIAHDDGITRADIQVSRLMLPVANLHALTIDEVESARIGDVVLTLSHLGEPDILVTHSTDDEIQIRGILSVSEISKELGLNFDVSSRANTFAELERAIIDGLGGAT